MQRLTLNWNYQCWCIYILGCGCWKKSVEVKTSYKHPLSLWFTKIVHHVSSFLEHKVFIFYLPIRSGLGSRLHYCTCIFTKNGMFSSKPWNDGVRICFYFFYYKIISTFFHPESREKNLKAQNHRVMFLGYSVRLPNIHIFFSLSYIRVIKHSFVIV